MFNKISFSIFVITLLSLSKVFAFCASADFHKVPTLNSGRVKPVYVQARESLKFISGKTSLDGLSASEIYCLLSVSENKSLAVKVTSIPILVEHVEAKKILDLPSSKSSFSFEELSVKHDFIRAKIMQMKESTPLKKELTKVWSRINKYKAISSGSDLQLFDGNSWVPLHAKFDRINSMSDYEKTLKKSESDYIKKYSDKYQLELFLFKSHIFLIALFILLTSVFATVLSKKLIWGAALAGLGIAVQIAGVTLRVLISGRAPITNMYETVMFSGLGALIISLMIMAYKKDKLFLLAGLGYNILCLFMMRFANNMLDESISPLVPVLRDNFWLSTHVTTIILSYAALAISWLLANIVLFKMIKKTMSKGEKRYYENLINTCVVVGVVLLSAGIILGGVWADYSWGRFWGWDPKETWSLIVFLFYITLLHGRYTNWLNPKKFILSVAGGFMTVMMAWFGVNYILASGLHSYGFSEGGAVFLGSFFLIQTAFLVFGAFKTSQGELS